MGSAGGSVEIQHKRYTETLITPKYHKAPPMHDSELAHSYQRLTATWGYFPLENWSVVTIKGDDRASFLHNLCTQEILQQQPGAGCELFLSDVKGHIIAHVYLQVEENSLRLLTVPDQATTIMDHLDRYIIREDVVLTDETNGWNSLVVLGPEAAPQLAGLADNRHATPLPVLQQPWQHTPLILAGDHPKLPPCEVTRTDWLHVPCYLLQFPTNPPEFSQPQDDPSINIYQVFEAAGAHCCGNSTWTTIRIESGLPLWGIDFNQENLPQEVARNELAISFHKGCYLGQETIARIDALGHVNRQITTLRFDGKDMPEPGTPLLAEGKQIGTVTSTCWSPHENSPLALAMVRRGFNAPGTQLESTVGAASVLNTPSC